MVIAPSFTTSSAVLTGVTSNPNVNISGATTGEWVYLFVTLGANQTAVTATGWALVLEGDESSGTSGTHYALFRRKKVAGDTTFTVSWPTSAKGTFGVASWTGLDATTPDEGAAMLLHTSGTSYPTPSVTPTAANRWAATFTYSRTSTTANKAITFTPDAGLTERLDFNNSGASSSPWTGQQVADSNGAVTQAAHTYTATQAFSESHGGAILLYLIPASAAAYSGSVALSGSGTLSLSGRPSVGGSLARSGSGSMTRSASPALTGSTALSGTGTVGLTATPAMTGGLALSGAGSVSSTGQPATTGALALTGDAALGVDGQAVVPALDVTVIVGPTRRREVTTVGPTRMGVAVDSTRGGLTVAPTRGRPLVTAGPTRTGTEAGPTRTGLAVDDTRTGLTVGPTRRDRGA